MRLWHIDLIPYLPKLQLLAQWRELNSIFKKQDKHILINYIYNYDKKYLYVYTIQVLDEMQKRHINIKSYTKFNAYFEDVCQKPILSSLRFTEQDDEYLTICYYNLREKYLRGQPDFSNELMFELNKFMLKGGGR